MADLEGGFPGESQARQAQPTAAAAGPKKSCCQKIRDLDTKSVISYLRYANLCNALCIITSGVVTVVTLSGGSFDLTTIFIGIYIAIFGCMLFCFECRLTRMEPDVRRNFGFLYSYTGRTLFIIFIATICFGATTGGDGGSALGYICGSITLVNAFFNCFVIYQHPAFGKGGIDRSADPGALYKSGDAIARDRAAKAARDNPDMVANAARGGVNYLANNKEARDAAIGYARENPDQVRAAAGAAYGASASGGNDNPFA